MAQVTGVDKVRRTLVERLPKRIRAELELAMEIGAQTIAIGARLRAPVGATGDVRDSIHAGRVKVGRRGGLYVAISAGNQATLAPANGIPYQVARMLEFGTVDMPAQPFLLPAFRLSRKRVKAAMRRAVVKAIMETT